MIEDMNKYQFSETKEQRKNKYQKKMKIEIMS